MQIPQHWAEARVVGRVNGRARVVRRFGWSELSAADAERHAEERARAALAELEAGRAVAPREQKLPYGGAGLPIREEVLARHGDLVITRNSYGARCLNEPDVLFADIDVQLSLPWPLEWLGGGLVAGVAIGGVALAVWSAFTVSPLACFGIGFATILAAVSVAAVLDWLRRRPSNRVRDTERRYRDLLRRVQELPGVRAAVYATPAGFRVLLLHALFDPTAPTTQALLASLRTDRAYAQMCALQACFRARVSGKPWRMGVRKIKPRPGVWPVHPDRRAVREQWIREYESVAHGFAACRFLVEIGSASVHPRCGEVQRMHDALSGARSAKPLA